MGLVLGLDIGGSTTKVIGFEDGEMLESVIVKASDPPASAYAGLGRFLESSGRKLSQIDQIMATGVGASYLSGDLLDRIGHRPHRVVRAPGQSQAAVRIIDDGTQRLIQLMGKP